MKFYSKSLLLGLAVVGLLTYSGCGPDGGSEPTEQEVQLGKLKTTWNISDVKLDGVSKTSGYTGFKLVIEGAIASGTLSSATYSTSGRPALSPWPSSGTWVFGSSPTTQITRDPDKTGDKLDMTYSVTDTQLQLTFSFARDGYSRTSNVKGQWVFTFTK